VQAAGWAGGRLAADWWWGHRVCCACCVQVARAKEFDYLVVNRDGQLDAAVAQIGSIIDVHKCSV
jgi:hypothetical protein